MTHTYPNLESLIIRLANGALTCRLFGPLPSPDAGMHVRETLCGKGGEPVPLILRTTIVE